MGCGHGMSGDLKWNKIFGAGLGTAFVILVVQQVSGAIYHTESPEKMGYFVDAPEEAAGGAEAELPPDWGTLLPVADVAAGEAAFARCQACHNIQQGGANGIGPNLFGAGDLIRRIDEIAHLFRRFGMIDQARRLLNDQDDEGRPQSRAENLVPL